VNNNQPVKAHELLFKVFRLKTIDYILSRLLSEIASDGNSGF